MSIQGLGLALLLSVFQQSAPEEWPLNTGKFQIPVRVQKERQAEIKELALHVSSDRGKTWEIYSKSKPGLEAFTFSAKQDGSYWFSVAVVDQNGKQEPTDIYKAAVGQKVLVDTVRPEVHLKGEKKGEDVYLQWNIKEINLDLESIKLDCKAVNDSPEEWTPIVIRPSAEGTGTFKYPGNGPLVIRMQLKDVAGNVGLAVEDVLISSIVVNNIKSPNPAISSKENSPAINSQPTIAIPVVPVEKNETAIIPPMNDPLPILNNPSIQSPLPKTDSIVKEKTGEISPLPNTVPVFPVSRISNPTEAIQTQIPSPGLNGVATNAIPPALASSTNPLPSQPGGLTQETIRSKNIIQIVNKRFVKIDLEVAKYGPSGIGSVEVYATMDEGNSWSLAHTEIPAVQPPADGKSFRHGVLVPIAQEGTPIGYYVVVKSKAGLGKAPPQKGDAPHARVELDSTAPEAVLYSPIANPGVSNALTLSWKATDKNFGANPILLEWSERKDGPWNPIGEGELQNTGKFNWVLPSTVPHKVFLKLTVRDSAGNAAVAQTSEPQLVDLQIPEVNVLGVSPGGK